MSTTRPEASPHGPAFRALHGLLLLVTVLPLASLPWLVEYWPAQDDPNHLAITHILDSLDEPGSVFTPHFESDLSFRPYMLQYYVLLGLGRWMSLMTAHRVLVTLIVVAMPLTLLLLLRRIAPERQANAFLVAPLATGWLLLLGLLNFCAGLLLVLVGVALGWGRRHGQAGTPEPPTPAALGVAALAFLLAAGFHPFAALVGGLVLLALEGPRLARPATWVRLAVVTGPAAALIVGNTLAYTGIENPQTLSFLRIVFLGFVPTLGLLLKNQVALSWWELPFRLPFVVLLVVGGLVAIRRHGVRGADRDASLARLVLVLLALTLLLPRYFIVVGHIVDRMGLLLLFACALVVKPPSALRTPLRLGLAALVACCGLAFVQYGAAVRESARIADIVEAGRGLPAGARVLPVNCDPRGSSAHVAAGLHAWGYLVLEREIVTPYLFAAGSRGPYGGPAVRPLIYRPGFVERSPFIHEAVPRFWSEWRRKVPELQLSYGTDLFFDLASAYDYVLLVSPPQDLVSFTRAHLVQEAQVGDVRVLRPFPTTARADSDRAKRE